MTPMLLNRSRFRHGYEHGFARSTVWGVIVDVFCITMLVWIVTGLYLWRKIRSSRSWGRITIGVLPALL